MIPIPKPRFVTFYNGKAALPEQSELKLSDAYGHPTDCPDLELKVQIININSGYNQQLLDHCRPLKDYMTLVNKIREYVKNMPLANAVDQSVEECIKENVMAEFLTKNKAEAKFMSIFEYDEELHIQQEREEAWEEGHTEGLAKGHTEGLTEGLAKGHTEGFNEGFTKGLEDGFRSLFRCIRTWMYRNKRFFIT